MIGLWMVLVVWLQAPSGFADALVGNWQGSLEYRDYRSDRRVTLPTQLVVSRAADGALTFGYTYDDGPGKTVRSQDRVTIDAVKQTYRVQNADGTYDATFAATGLPGFRAAGTVVMTGAGDENSVPVDLRITVTVTAASLTMLRESRRPGEEYLFRNRYELKR